ncbi:MAG: response regulator [Alphaproteobacteria bacterium]
MKTCLVVDDSRLMRRLARSAVESMTYDVSEAADGEEALAACRSAMPDTIMLDWNMPVMSGIEFLRALRAMDNGDHPIVIFCTTESDPEKISEAIEAGANEFIMKPYDAEIVQLKFEQAGAL